MLQLGDHDQLLAFAQQALEDAAQAAQLLEKRVSVHREGGAAWREGAVGIWLSDWRGGANNNIHTTP